jgi:probable rRNA maturation factor
LGCSEKELSILFIDDPGMAQLNERYLGRKGPTNVLAFPMASGPEPGYESPMLGDVVISVDTALREAGELNEDPDFTINRLLIHGVLHLLGYDHTQTEAEAARMEQKERQLMALILGD